MESLMRLCWRLFHSTAKGYCPLSLRGTRLGVRLVMAEVAQPTSNQGSRNRGRNFFSVSITGQRVTQSSAACKVGFGRRPEIQPRIDTNELEYTNYENDHERSLPI